MPSDHEQVTLLLKDWSAGNRESLDRLMPLLYDQLHRLASSCLRSERNDHTLKVSLDEAVVVGPELSSEIVELDDALKVLAERDPRKAEIVNLIFFGGLTYDETARALGISDVTVHRELKMAKAFLHAQLAKSEPAS